ncbi:MAG: hypothetical protein HKO76_10765 [Acidimicrobiia bacterium]|nr:hypothetical protein [Acidimicrobiia bacterium]
MLGHLHVASVNFTLLSILAVLATAAAVRAIHRRKPQRLLLSILAVDFSYVAAFIFFYSGRPDLTPDVWIWHVDIGRVAYWPLYAALIVAYIGFHSTLGDDVDDETRRIVEKVTDNVTD